MSDSLQIYHEIYLLAVYLEISEFVIKFFFIPFIVFLFHIWPALYLDNSMAVWTFFFLTFCKLLSFLIISSLGVIIY